jgi:kinetochore protein Nuf2
MVYPERERTIDLLSAFINFIKFTEQWCSPFIKELRDKSVAVITEREQVALELAEMQEKIKKLK